VVVADAGQGHLGHFRCDPALAIVAVILTKKNTAGDVTATGKAFTGALSTAQKG
jgi:hypothetical protein